MMSNARDDTASSVEEADVRSGAAKATMGAISARGFAFKVVEFSEVDGRALVEGDIDVGRAADAVSMLDTLQKAESQADAHAAVVSDKSRLWPDGIVPVVLPDGGVLRDLATAAIAAVEAKTNVRFPQRADEPDYLSFQEAAYSSSPVGRIGGEQTIKLSPESTVGTAIHEVCHTLGLWHEQSREDRDSFVRIHWQNIRDGYEHNFRQHISDGDDFGDYNYDSIMHYPPQAFSRNGQATITPVIGTPRIGQRFRLSEGDIAAINTLYPHQSTDQRPVPQPDRSTVPSSLLQGFTRQFSTEVPANGVGRLVTGGWPRDRAVDWRLLPTVPSESADPQLSWQIELSLGADLRLAYFFTIENKAAVPQTVEAWYRFL